MPFPQARARNIGDCMAGLKRCLGVDLGSTKTTVTLWWAGGDDDKPRKAARISWQTSRVGPEPTIEHIVEAGERLLGEHGGDKDSLQAIGVSAGGPLHPERGGAHAFLGAAIAHIWRRSINIEK